MQNTRSDTVTSLSMNSPSNKPDIFYWSTQERFTLTDNRSFDSGLNVYAI
jgi:hypothetical protein